MRERSSGNTSRNSGQVTAFVIFAALIAARLNEGADERVSGHFHVSDGDTLSLSGVRESDTVSTHSCKGAKSEAAVIATV